MCRVFLLHREQDFCNFCCKPSKIKFCIEGVSVGEICNTLLDSNEGFSVKIFWSGLLMNLWTLVCYQRICIAQLVLWVYWSRWRVPFLSCQRLCILCLFHWRWLNFDYKIPVVRWVAFGDHYTRRFWVWDQPITNAWLTHWGRVTHICVGNLTIIGSDNGLSPGRRQAII